MFPMNQRKHSRSPKVTTHCNKQINLHFRITWRTDSIIVNRGRKAILVSSEGDQNLEITGINERVWEYECWRG